MQIENDGIAFAPCGRMTARARDHAVIVAGFIGKLERLAVRRGRRCGKSDGRFLVWDDGDLPVADRVSVRPHPHMGARPKRRARRIFAIAAFETRAVQRDRRRMVRAMNPADSTPILAAPKPHAVRLSPDISAPRRYRAAGRSRHPAWRPVRRRPKAAKIFCFHSEPAASAPRTIRTRTTKRRARGSRRGRSERGRGGERTQQPQPQAEMGAPQLFREGIAGARG